MRRANVTGTRRLLLSLQPSDTRQPSAYRLWFLRKLLGASTLRKGDGVIALPDSRRRERLLQAGRTKLTSKVKLETLRSDYNPRLDTCIKAFVRLLAAQNTDEQ